MSNQSQSSFNSNPNHSQHSQRYSQSQQNINNNQQQVGQQVGQQAHAQHNYIERYFNNYSDDNKSTLSFVFNRLTQDVIDLKVKENEVGMEVEIANSIIQEHRHSHSQSTFIDSNGETQALNFKQFAIDQLVGNDNEKFAEYKDITNIRRKARRSYDNRNNNNLFTNINRQLLECYERAIQSNVKHIFYVAADKTVVIVCHCDKLWS